MLQNVNEVNRARLPFSGIIIVRDLTRQNGLVTLCFRLLKVNMLAKSPNEQ